MINHMALAPLDGYIRHHKDGIPADYLYGVGRSVEVQDWEYHIVRPIRREEEIQGLFPDEYLQENGDIHIPIIKE